MNLLDLIQRTPQPQPWAEGEKIPWNDPDFSARMLKEHLSQAHDAASRRAPRIDQHVNWIHTQLLAGQPAYILDLGCGPGLYASRLAALGHTCTGLDFSPASIAYARQQAAAQSLNCTYTQGDIRQANFGQGYDLVMFIFGEFNVFTSEEARLILRKAHAALQPGGLLLLEPHTYEAVRDLGQAPATWYSSASGLFSDQPHLVLNESFWDEARGVTTERYYVVDAASGQVTRHASSMQAYHDADYRALLNECGYDGVTFYPSLAGGEAVQPGLIALTARRNTL
ncbi:MAG: class I SAM-dependent methyltransferase [Anaerolineae bacterium]|nr:class I SAM-dependent methyltransferase [Anaerolineae bacterium]